jgi:ABC-type Na+ transport system ATPase subunit NatA
LGISENQLMQMTNEELLEAGANVNDLLSNQLENTIKDLHYLTEMQKLEDPVYAHQSKSFHIVPISGWVNFSTLHHRSLLE